MSDQQVIVAIFDNEAAADAAVAALNTWDEETVDMDLDAIGVLVAGDDGKVKEHKLGRRSTGKGAGIGLVLAVIAPPTLLAGVVAGGIAGHFHHRGLGLTQADLDRLGGELRREGRRRHPGRSGRRGADRGQARVARRNGGSA